MKPLNETNSEEEDFIPCQKLSHAVSLTNSERNHLFIFAVSVNILVMVERTQFLSLPSIVIKKPFWFEVFRMWKMFWIFHDISHVNKESGCSRETEVFSGCWCKITM